MTSQTADSADGSSMEVASIRVFGIDDTEAGRVDRSQYKKGDEFRYGRADIPIDVFKRRVETFMAAMGEVIGGVAAKAGDYSLEEVTVSVEVSAKGKLSLLGTGGELAGKGGLTFTFKKSAPPHQGE